MVLQYGEREPITSHGFAQNPIVSLWVFVLVFHIRDVARYGLEFQRAGRGAMADKAP